MKLSRVSLGVLFGVLLSFCSGTVSSQMVTAPIPYVPGSSFGPFGPIQNPILEQDYTNYAFVWWAWVDSGFTNAGPLNNFNFAHPGLLPYNSPSSVPVDVDPFGEGRVVFEDLYAHRLSESFGFDDLIYADPLVSLTWRHWTFTRQIATADFIDPIAHQVHIAALIDAVISNDGYTTRGVPYFDGTLCVSDRTKKKLRNNPVAPPNPVNVAGLPAKIQAVHNHICMKAGTLANQPGLYMADGGPGMVGFDCDDFADAIGGHIQRTSPEAGVTYTNKYVSWKNGMGADVAHLVTKISFCGYFWLVDAQTGTKIGPFADGTAIDASPLIMGGYDVGMGSAITTGKKCYAPGDRGDWKGEPPPWYTDPAKVQHFENITGLDADDFVRPGITPAMVPAGP